MKKALTPTGLELLMKFPAELGPSISTISETESLDEPTPVPAEYPSVIIESSWATDGDELA